MKKGLLLVLDGLGIGAAPDAERFGDEGANTLGHLLDSFPELNAPTLSALGLMDLLVPKTKASRASSTQSFGGRNGFARLQEVSAGKDTTTGHWEMMGLITSEAFDVFPEGFSEKWLSTLAEKARLPGFIGNLPASGTEIIRRLGEEHIRTGKPIVYTSADSVFQLAAHEESFGRERLYEVCALAREQWDRSEYKLGRVIARPFTGDSTESFKRTPYRKDFSVAMPGRSFLEDCADAGLDVIGIGKVPSIYNHQFFTEELPGKTDAEALESLHRRWSEPFEGFCFINLNELDSLFAHRRDPLGYKEHLEWIDAQLAEFIPEMEEGSLLMITADHGNDPHFEGSDHTREWVPLLTHEPGPLALRKAWGDFKGFGVVAQTLGDYFGLPVDYHSHSLFRDEGGLARGN